MDTQRPLSQAAAREGRGPLRAALAAVALGLLVGQLAAAGLPGAREKVGTRPLDRAETGVVSTPLVEAAVVYAAVTQPRAPVLGLAQALAGVYARATAERFWFDDRRGGAAGAAQVAGARTPLLAMPLYLGGVQKRVWFEPVPSQAPPLNAAWLDQVRDEKQFLDLRKIMPDELGLPRYRGPYQEYLAYCQAVVLAAQTPADAFARSAADNPELNFSTLYNEPDRQRGKVVHLEGKLKRLSRYDAPQLALRQGVKWVYEGWIFRDTPGPPVVVIFTDLPPGLKLGDFAQPPRVTFDGYFFKKFKYRSGNKDRAGNWRPMTSLQFIGPTLKVQTGPVRRTGPPASSPLQGPVIYGVIGFVGFMVALLVAVSLWYRRSDRDIRARLLALEGERFAAEELEAGHDGAPLDGQSGAPEGQGQRHNGHPPAGDTARH